MICGLKRIEKNNIILDKIEKEGCFHIEDFILDNIEIISNNIMGSRCNKLYRADIIKSYNLQFDTSIEYAEDFIFNYSYLSKIDNISIISDCLYNYNRILENSLSSKFSEDCFENLNHIYEQTISFLHQ